VHQQILNPDLTSVTMRANSVPAIDDTLRATFGFSTFRPLQREIVETILSGQDTFVLMPTGGGKSLCYQLPALLLEGLTVVVSPLIALMKDQVDALRQLGVAATYINSSLDAREIGTRQSAVSRGEVKLLYVAPERLALPGFLRLLDAAGVAMFAIDEAHCISEWGHDFRPEYRELAALRDRFPHAIFAAFTATATPVVERDIRGQLALLDAPSFRGSFNRENLYYDVRPKRNAFEQLLAYVAEHNGLAGIVYCATRSTTEDVAERLRVNGVRAAAYHGGMDSAERDRVQEAFVHDDIDVVVATVAFGMGIDKPDVRFVIHYDLPKNLESFYQESGRAGRDGEPADCILFYSYGDVAKLMHVIENRPTDALKDVTRTQLRQVTGWAEGTSCRRRALLAYFDEPFEAQPDPCCDVCSSPAELVDFTIEAQKFLSCVKRTGERFGSAYVIDVLRGSEAERIQRFGHNRLSTWGIGRDLSKAEWQYIARALVREGYARQAPEDYNTIKITQRGYDLLFRGARLELPPAPKPKERKRERLDLSTVSANPALFERLRALRKRIADERGVPPYVIFHDSSLRMMAATLPMTRAELLHVQGVGEKRAADLGEDFLDEIARFVVETGAEPVAVEQPERPRAETRRERTGDTYRATLLLFEAGRSIDEIAAERRLSATTIEAHLVRLIESGAVLDIERLVPHDQHEAIDAAFNTLGDTSLTPVLEALGDGYTYFELDVVRALRRASPAS
jgi:ATP-dependent DNA helicase RecQ